MKKRYLTYTAVLMVILMTASYIDARDDDAPQKTRTRVMIENADRISNNELKAPGVQVLSGNVRFRHGNTSMTCDSAHYQRNNNSFYAMGTVHVNEGDTLTLDCDRMDYLGDRELIKAYGNVKLVNKTTTLTTDTLDYDRIAQTAYYYNHATIRDGKNTLTSQIGIYTVPENMTDFYVGVEAKSPDYEMYGDTMHYGTVSKIITIQGPTYIVSDENRIYTEHGVYDTNTEISDFTKNTRVYYGTSRMLTGDRVHYDRFAGYAKAEENVVIRDTSRRVMVAGNVAEYFELKDSTVFPDEPRVAFFGQDTLYLRAGMIQIVPLKDTVDYEKKRQEELFSRLVAEEETPSVPPVENDTVTTSQKDADEYVEMDTIPWQMSSDDDFFHGRGEYARHVMTRDTARADRNMPRLIRAYDNVRYYKHDMSGLTDSITYNQHTGVMSMFGTPVVFSQRNQITGDTILVKRDLEREVTDSVLIYNNAFIISRDARNDLQFNQISGTYIRGKVIDDDLRRVYITGNAQVLYYTYDSDGNSIGLNLSKASRMMVMLKNSMVQRIRFIKSPDGQITDLGNVTEEMKQLKGFLLREDEAPHNAEEIWGKDAYDIRLEIDY